MKLLILPEKFKEYHIVYMPIEEIKYGDIPQTCIEEIKPKNIAESFAFSYHGWPVYSPKVKGEKKL